MTAEPKKVLVVDDEPDVVTYLETLLRDNGYATIAAADGKEGMEKLRREHPDLVCLDITMPVESGIRFYRDLRCDPELGRTPVIVVTAVTGYGADPAPFRNFLGTRRQFPPPEGFFSKPIDRDKFLAAVKNVLG
ncbi:MAG: response regulator [Deltaproteobacteria bacterium]|nr:response regulator [Deltaproteobacteria bacterium]